MKMVSVLLFFAVLVAGCASSRSPYRSRNTDISSAALKGFVAGTRGLLEGRAEARKKRQLRDALISDSIRTLGAPDKVLSDSGSIVYYWENLTIGVVIQHLGTPDGTKSDKQITLYRWGSYIFSDTPYFSGVLCIKKLDF